MKFRWLAWIALPLSAHVMSMSSGEATVSGNRVDYILRVPFYEVEQVSHPETALLAHISFAGGERQNEKCFHDGESYVCAAEYLFSRPVQNLDVNCTLYEAIAPNHVHVLHATRDGKQDRAFFDYTFTSATLRFRPPSAWETGLERMTQGAIRGVAGPFQLLFLLTLAMAARSRRELVLIVAAYLFGLVTAVMAGYHPQERFAECAAALGVAYLAVEILFIPQGGVRWWIGGLLGLFHGLYLSLFTGAEIPLFVSGAAVASAVVCLVGGLVMVKRLPRWAAALPLAISVFWFITRLR